MITSLNSLTSAERMRLGRWARNGSPIVTLTGVRLRNEPGSAIDSLPEMATGRTGTPVRRAQ